ncbi:hypothetical protein [Cellulomonas telluris]|uniref:hypothetical protein n=1 Tax=Cellulomonas telluris TaxID=2306636 RepID=UPI0010A75B32|nr:hypothetical protein [Cellulomonas telluris]
MPDQLHDVLDRLLQAVGDVVHAIALDPVDRVVLADGDAPADVVAAARAVATTLALVDTTGAQAVRAVVETADATLYAVHDPAGLVVVLVGPPLWNIALARRTADPLLRDLDADAVVAPLRAARRVPAAATPARGETLAQAHRADAVAVRQTGRTP